MPLDALAKVSVACQEIKVAKAKVDRIPCSCAQPVWSNPRLWILIELLILMTSQSICFATRSTDGSRAYYCRYKSTAESGDVTMMLRNPLH